MSSDKVAVQKYNRALIDEKVAQAREAEKRQNLKRGLHESVAAHATYVPTTAGDIRVLEYGFEQSTLQPLLIDLHGGGFIMNTADIDEKMLLRIRGRVPYCKCISIDYPKAPEHPFPAAPDAVYEVVSAYMKQAEQRGINTERVVIAGHSAGGNLAAVTCLRAAQKGEWSFCGQILDYPPLDLATPASEKPQPEGAIPVELADLFDACYITSHDPCDPDISPVRADPALLCKVPRALIISCGIDSLGKESKQYAHLLEQAGVPVELVEYPQERHGFTYDETLSANEAVDHMAAFLGKCIS